MTPSSDPTAHAALAICESLLLALSETGALDAHEAQGVLADAAATHREAVTAGADARLHGAVAEIIEAMLRRLNLTSGG